jgi:hypothetical protein
VSAVDRRQIQALLWALKPLLNLRGSIPLPYVVTFLHVALDEGKTVGAYAKAMGVHRWRMSRYLRNIGDRARTGGPGLNWVTAKPSSSRRKQIVLTEKGRLIAGQIFRKIGHG